MNVVSRGKTGAARIETALRQMTKQSFGHLTATGISSTQKEHLPRLALRHISSVAMIYAAING
jgi:hypothetical protein